MPSPHTILAVSGVVDVAPLLAELTQTAEVLSNLGLQAILVLWVFAFGACVGSFLNVVAYRLPLGLSLSHPPSRCPFCETAIRKRHNIPILGWLAINGRCAACSAPIPVRYPLVEALTATVFALLFVIDIGLGGANLPQSMIDSRFSADDWRFRSELLLLFLQHVTLASLSIAALLMTIDRKPVPHRLAFFGVAVFLTISMILPTIPPVSATALLSSEPIVTSRLMAIVTLCTGGLCGLAVAALLRITVGNPTTDQREELFVVGSLCGFVLGWQAMIGLGVLTIFLRIFLGQLQYAASQVLYRFPIVGWMGIAIMIWLPLWTFLAADHLVMLSFHLLLLILLVMLSRWLTLQLPPIHETTSIWIASPESIAIRDQNLLGLVTTKPGQQSDPDQSSASAETATLEASQLPDSVERPIDSEDTRAV